MRLPVPVAIAAAALVAGTLAGSTASVAHAETHAETHADLSAGHVVAGATARRHARNLSPYVALGDSYSATGLAPVLPGPGGSECGRSTSTYSHLVADRLHVKRFRDAACGGADTSDYAHAQYADIAPQLDAVRRGTRLVTMTIGGNDENVFSGLITACAIASTAERQTTGSISGDPCRRQYRATFRQKIQQETYPRVLEALRAVHRKAPEATVAILGYPGILPAVGVPACYPNVPISMGDVPYLDRTQRTLNHVIERAAHRTGTLFVDTSRISAGHDACQPVGTRWIEPLIGGTSTPLHPNVAGHAAMAEKTLARLGA